MSKRPLRFDRMGESAVLITLGGSISQRTSSRVHALARALAGAELPAVLETVPSYASLLVLFDLARVDPLELRARVKELHAGLGEAKASRRRPVVVPVRYGGEWGPDLEDVARLNGLTCDEAVRLHTSRTYRVYFVGFMPGFAYMGTLPARIATPRLNTPRPRVPAGSVGIAGRQTGMYPFSSPGGWRLIGATGVPLWDPRRAKPALLPPGTQVRFLSTEESPEQSPAPQAAQTPRHPVFEVLEPGPLTTVQDLGRPGYADVGLSRGGAMDPQAIAEANRLLGNEPGSAALEITWAGPTLRALRTTVIALMGADFGYSSGGRRVPVGVSWLVRARTTLRCESPGPAPGRARAYLGVAGGFDVPAVLGSRSTYLPGNFGGLDGRPLRSGDVLGMENAVEAPAGLAGRVAQNEYVPVSPVATLRYTRFRGPGAPDDETQERLCGQEFVVSGQGDRVGTRLSGVSLLGARLSGELLSFGVVRGAIQLPPDGNPVILSADHQTTGGYPVAGVVIEADWRLVAQLVPGARVRFAQVSVDEAIGARRI